MKKLIYAAAAAVAALAGFGVVALTGSSAVAPSVFVSATGSDTAACTSAAPCKTFGRAYRVATPGQVVEVAGGTYPQQTIPVVAGRAAPDVTFKPAAGQTVTVNCGTIGTVGNGTINGATCIDILGSYVTFDGGPDKAFKTQTYTVNGFSYQGRIDTERGCRNVTLTSVDAGSFTDACSTGFRTTFSDYGPSVDPLNIYISDDVNDVYVGDTLIHDFVIVNGGHFECVYWQGVTNAWFDHNEFRSCAVYGIHSKEVGDKTYSSKNAKLTGNVFWNPRGLTTQADVQMVNEIPGTLCLNSTVTDNVFTDGLLNDCTPTVDQPNTFRSQTDPPPASPIRTGTVPPPPPVTTTVVTTVPNPPPPPVYAPACQPTCDQQITDLNAKVAAQQAVSAGLQARIDKASAALAP